MHGKRPGRLGRGTGLQAQAAGKGDHCAVIGAEFQFRVIDTETLAPGFVVERGTQLLVGSDATGNNQLLEAGLLHCLEGFFHQHLDNRLLESTGSIGPEAFIQRLRLFAHQGQHGSLEAREAEVEVAGMQHRSRQGIGGRIATFGQPGEQGPARVRQAEQLGALVKGLAGGVIQRFAQQFVSTHAGDFHQLGMAAGNQQGDEGKGRRGAREQRRQQMPFEVMHRDGGLVDGQRQRLGKGTTH